MTHQLTAFSEALMNFHTHYRKYVDTLIYTLIYSNKMVIKVAYEVGAILMIFLFERAEVTTSPRLSV